MRFYAMGNSYLSSIQQGIQAFHVLGEMVLKYDEPELATDFMVYNWMDDHKTLVCLNGGNFAKMVSVYEFLQSEDNPYPYAKFHEDDESLEGMLTSIGIIVPEKIYKANLDEPDGSLTPWEFELATLLRRMPTAR